MYIQSYNGYVGYLPTKERKNPEKILKKPFLVTKIRACIF